MLAISATITGISLGLLLGSLSFAIVLLFKSTGVPNFAQGNIATLGAFIVYMLGRHNSLPMVLEIIIAIVITAVIGSGIYYFVMRPNQRADDLNLAARTLATYLLIYAVINDAWGQGQPFEPKSLFSSGSIDLGGVSIPISSIGILCIAVALAAGSWALFRFTRVGLLLRGMAEQPTIARELGAPIVKLAALAWALAAGVSVIVGVLVGPTSLLSSNMMDLYLMYAFAAAILGGLTSLWGAYVGGLLIGVVVNLSATYGNEALPTVSVFVLLLLVLFIRPVGIFGREVPERL